MGSIMSKDPERFSWLNLNLLRNSYKALASSSTSESITSELAEEGTKISNFAVLPANGWNHFCGKSKSEEEEDAAVVDVAEPKPGDIAISVNTFNIVGFFSPESNLGGSWLNPVEQGRLERGVGGVGVSDSSAASPCFESNLCSVSTILSLYAPLYDALFLKGYKLDMLKISQTFNIQPPPTFHKTESSPSSTASRGMPTNTKRLRERWQT